MKYRTEGLTHNSTFTSCPASDLRFIAPGYLKVVEEVHSGMNLLL
jgi:hypothetical protein